MKDTFVHVSILDSCRIYKSSKWGVYKEEMLKVCMNNNELWNLFNIHFLNINLKMARTNEKSLVEVSGVVSPLALQLQEAWLQTQMPKAQKQSLIPLTTTPTNTSEEISVRDSILPLPKNSMLKSLATIFPEVDATSTKQDQPTIPSTLKGGDVSTQPKARANINRVHPMNSLINGVNHVQSIKPSCIMQKCSELPLVKVLPSFTTQPLPNVQSSNVSTLPTSLQKLEPIGVSNVDPLDVVEIVEENQPLFSYLNGLMDENLEEVVDNDPQMMARELGVLTGDHPP